MSFRFSIRPETEADVREAAGWYEGERRGRGNAFVGEVDRVFEALVENPLRFPRTESPVRTALAQRFPYGVYFLIRKDLVRVLAVLHFSRHSQTWKRRTP